MQFLMPYLPQQILKTISPMNSTLRFLLFSLLFLLNGFLLQGQDTSRLRILEWQSLFPLRQGQQVTQSENKIFYIASQSIVSIDKSDFSIEQFDKSSGLSDVKLKFIQFNTFRKELIIAYQDGVFDIMDQKGKVVSLPQIRNFKNFTGDKSINQLYLAAGDLLLIATQYGVSALNLAKREFSFSVFTGLPVKNVILHKGFIYAATEKGLYRIEANHANPENFNNWKWLTIEEGVQPKTDEKGIPIIKGKNTKGHIIYFYANGTVINTVTKEMRNWLPKEPILEEANIKKPTENPIIETEKIVYEEPPSYDEKCKGCGKELYYPKNRKCSWCGNFFDGWSPNEKYDKVAFPILCSDIASEGEAMFFPYYHNGKDWRTYSNCYCSNKCYKEAEN